MNKQGKSVLKYGAVAAATAVFSYVYNRFGHGVRSWCMDWACLVPAVGGLLSLWLREGRPRVALRYGMWTLLAYMLLRGVVEIAGTNSAYLPAFLAVGTVCWAAALTDALAARLQQRARAKKRDADE